MRVMVTVFGVLTLFLVGFPAIGAAKNTESGLSSSHKSNSTSPAKHTSSKCLATSTHEATPYIVTVTESVALSLVFDILDVSVRLATGTTKNYDGCTASTSTISSKACKVSSKSNSVCSDGAQQATATVTETKTKTEVETSITVKTEKVTTVETNTKIKTSTKVHKTTAKATTTASKSFSTISGVWNGTTLHRNGTRTHVKPSKSHTKTSISATLGSHDSHDSNDSNDSNDSD